MLFFLSVPLFPFLLFREETGLKCDASQLRLVCSYQATVVTKKRGYFIAFYTAPVDAGNSTAFDLLKNVEADEVAAACLVPTALLRTGALSPRKITGRSHEENVEAAKGCGESSLLLRGVEVAEDGTVTPKDFEQLDLIGDGGEGDGKGGGMGMGHRFASAVFAGAVRTGARPDKY